MSLHTPVILTEDPARTAAARSRHWPVVSRDGARLRISGVTQSAPLPQPVMDIAAGSLSGESAAGWKFVLDWIAKYAHRPLLVLEPDSWAGDLGRWAQATRGWAWAEPDDLGELGDAALIEVAAAPAPPAPADRLPDGGRLLLVRHGDLTQRQRDWMTAAADAGLVVDVATDRPIEGPQRLHVVPDLGPANLTVGPGPLDPVHALALSRAAESGDPTPGPAAHWQVALERWFEPRPDDFDVVVLSGPPVGFFGFGAFAARHWYARVVIDHETHAPWPTGDRLHKYREQGWHLAADAVTVADESLLQVVEPSGPDAAVGVLDGAAMAPLLRLLSDHSFPVS